MLKRALLQGLRSTAEPSRAPAMQAYMKSEMPFLGVAATPLRQVCREVFAAHPISSPASWRREALAIWRGAQFREERYAAIELTGFKPYRDYNDLGALPVYEEMIVDGAWWDYVDVVAAHRVGALLLRNFPARMKREMRRWSVDDDVWKRRTSIICQLTFKQDTDLDLLYACIEPSLGSREFFLRKAIGWALRQYAWTNPEEVRRYVKNRGRDLSGLSRREALENISRTIAP